ncbi:MAG: BRO family protein [Patescibacteria group bacterium]|nr:BRO family protein [Patescibacteria group bacterium]MDD5164276.1 BRO family protein [Patescibacteria group bacterium]MDD5535043.1 BRO family protein [Patescibacteria group bacterium]
MINNKQITIFEGQKIRRLWDEKKEKWYFSVIDIMAVLTEQPDFKKAQSYWTTLKNRLKQEGNESVTKCDKLKLQSTDGKYYKTDTADVETILRLIQSVPSKKAEPIKLWLARVGYERIQETVDPEKSINRGRMNWQRMGRSQKWIQQRMMGQEIRNKLTDYWKNNEVKEQDEYAILTNIIHQEWIDLSVKDHKNLKKLKTENLRDHMTDAELVFSALAELSTREIAETMKTKGLEENKIPAVKGGRIAKNARLELEQKTGKSVVSRENFLQSPKNGKKLIKK